jgi:hypothetical protein
MKESKNWLVRLFKKWWFPWLLGGVILRLFLMPTTFHFDLWGHSFSAYFLAYQGEWNLYDTLANLPQSHPLVANLGVSDIFIYPPLTYYTLAFFRVLVKPFTDPNFIPWLMKNLSLFYYYPSLMRHLFLFKLPYLFIDVFLGFILASFFKEKAKKSLAFLLWMFNPVTLYATFMIGQLDVLPTLFVVLALWAAVKKKKVWSLIFLGIGGSYKMFPLLLIPPAAFFLGEKFKEKIKLLIAGFLPFLFFIAPFLNSKAFRAMVFSPKSQKMLFMGWPLSGAEVVYPFLLILTVIYFSAYYLRQKNISLFKYLNIYFLAIFLLIYSVTHYHPQWFLWITPFLILDWVENKGRNKLLVGILFLCWLIITFLFEPSLSIGLFSPLWPQLSQAPDLSVLLSRYFDVFQFKSLIRSIFAGTAVFFILRLFLPRLKNES